MKKVQKRLLMLSFFICFLQMVGNIQELYEREKNFKKLLNDTSNDMLSKAVAEYRLISFKLKNGFVTENLTKRRNISSLKDGNPGLALKRIALFDNIKKLLRNAKQVSFAEILKKLDELDLIFLDKNTYEQNGIELLNNIWLFALQNGAITIDSINTGPISDKEFHKKMLELFVLADLLLKEAAYASQHELRSFVAELKDSYALIQDAIDYLAERKVAQDMIEYLSGHRDSKRKMSVTLRGRSRKRSVTRRRNSVANMVDAASNLFEKQKSEFQKKYEKYQLPLINIQKEFKKIQDGYKNGSFASKSEAVNVLEERLIRLGNGKRYNIYEYAIALEYYKKLLSYLESFIEKIHVDSNNNGSLFEKLYKLYSRLKYTASNGRANTLYQIILGDNINNPGIGIGRSAITESYQRLKLLIADEPMNQKEAIAAIAKILMNPFDKRLYDFYLNDLKNQYYARMKNIKQSQQKSDVQNNKFEINTLQNDQSRINQLYQSIKNEIRFLESDQYKPITAKDIVSLKESIASLLDKISKLPVEQDVGKEKSRAL